VSATPVTVRLSIHVPDGAVHVRELGTASQVILGRDPQCDVVIPHHSVSRKHLRLRRDDRDHWSAEDLASKNGTRIDGRTLGGLQPLLSSMWFAIGDVYVRFEFVDPRSERVRDADVERRRHSSMIWNTRLRHGTEAQRLIVDLLSGIVDVAGAKRGFLLCTDRNGDWRVRACHAIDPDELAGQAFSGSRGAVNRAISAQRPVFLSDQRDQAWLQQQASVLDAGIRALVALPLVHDGRALGVIYADTDENERIYTDLDAQLLDALVDHAGNVVAALELEADLAELRALLVGADGMSAELGPAPYWSNASAASRQASPV